MNELSEIQRTLGRIESRQEAADNERTGMHALLQAFDYKLDCLPLLKDRMDKMEPHVEDWKRMKQRGIGIFGAVAVGGGVIGSYVGKLAALIGIVPK